MDAWALVVEKPEEISWRLKHIDTGPSHETVIAPLAVGLCGTDLEIISGAIDPAYIRYPVTLGHEWCGRVLDDGPLHNALVVVEGVIPCWQCRSCRAGKTNLCESYQEIGFTRDGAASGAISVPTSLIHPLSHGVSALQGALVEPCAVVYRAMSRANLTPNLRVLVVGDGTIALLAAHLLSLFSPARVDMLGKRPPQAELATQAGVGDFFTDPSDVPSNYELVIEAAGSPESVATAVEKTARGATVLLLGLAGNDKSVALMVDDLVNKDLSLLGSFSYTSRAFSDVVNLLNSSLIRPEFVVTHRFAITQWHEALDRLRGSDGVRGKVILELEGELR